MSRLRFLPICCLFTIAAFSLPRAIKSAEMAMGFRVGEVTQTSAIVWTRITRDKERNWNGVREKKKRQPRVSEYIPSPVAVADRQGESVGAPGQIRLRYAPVSNANAEIETAWVTVTAEKDFSHQFSLVELTPNTKYQLRVEARDTADAPITAKAQGSFATPAAQDEWQDVQFTVVTGQSYWDLDHRSGYHMYPAMQKLAPHFMIPTGDTVYLDSEAPRARTVELARYHWHRMYSLPRHVEFHRQACA